jgi:hypothetical protein
MQAIMAQAQKMQRDLKKANEELAKQEFRVSKSGAIEVVVLGNKTISEVHISEDAFETDNREMVEEMIRLAINDAFKNIDKAIEDINERITGRREGIGM